MKKQEKCPHVNEYNIPLKKVKDGRTVCVDVGNIFSSLLFTGYNSKDIITFINGDELKYIPSEELTNELFVAGNPIISLSPNTVLIKKDGNLSVETYKNFEKILKTLF